MYESKASSSKSGSEETAGDFAIGGRTTLVPALEVGEPAMGVIVAFDPLDAFLGFGAMSGDLMIRLSVSRFHYSKDGTTWYRYQVLGKSEFVLGTPA